MRPFNRPSDRSICARLSGAEGKLQLQMAARGRPSGQKSHHDAALRRPFLSLGRGQQLGDLSAAKKSLKEAAKCDPNHVDTLLQLG